MKCYLYNKETNELIKEFDNVISWAYDFVEYKDVCRCRIYCNDDEYITDKEVDNG